MKSVAPIVAAMMLAAASPAFAQYGAAQAGALAYCAARANGASQEESDKAAVRAIYSQVGLVSLVVSGRDIGNQARFLVAQMCPGQ